MTFAAPSPALAQDIAAALDWWRDAGLDHDFADQPADWLAQPAPAAQTPPSDQGTEPQTRASVPGLDPAPTLAPAAFAAPPSQPIAGSAAQWPQTLAEFQAWWLSEPSLDGGMVSARVPPRGPGEAALMVLIDHPDAEDAQRLLSGPRGALLDAILTALGLGGDQAYVAALVPRHMPLPDWDDLARRGFGAAALHHIALAAPRRVISFGPNVSSLLGHDPPKSAETLTPIDQVGADIPALAAPGLDTLMARPRAKARLWQALLDWYPA